MNHAEIVFTFPDTHSAMAGERALTEAGVPVRVMSKPSSLGEGCGICLRVDPVERNRAEAVFRGKVRTAGVFLKTRENGATCYEPA